MISKKTFVNTINKIIDYNNMSNEINDVFSKYRTEDCNSVFYGFYEDVVVNLLTEAMNDKDEWISWWLYECNYGQDTMKYATIGPDNVEIDLSTPEKLYDFLVKEYNEEEN